MYQIFIDTTDRCNKRVELLESPNKEAKSPTKVGELTGTKEFTQVAVDSISGDIDIVESIQKLLKHNSLNLSGISEFVPNTGPGSFTGIKIGVTVANVLNWILGKKSLGELASPNYGRPANITKRVF